jgi:hypothetical protein
VPPSSGFKWLVSTYSTTSYQKSEGHNLDTVPSEDPVYNYDCLRNLGDYKYPMVVTESLYTDARIVQWDTFIGTLDTQNELY